MRGNPFHGDGSQAVANIRLEHSLNVVTKQTGSTCKVAAVNLNIRFTLALPRAKKAAISSSTRAVWRSFVSFARGYAQRHRTIYLQCARNFVTGRNARAMRTAFNSRPKAPHARH